MAQVKHDHRGRPIIQMLVEGGFGSFKQNMLIDMGATISLLSSELEPRLKLIRIMELKVLEGFNGKENLTPYTYPLPCAIGSLHTKVSFGIQSLMSGGILGIDVIKQIH